MDIKFNFNRIKKTKLLALSVAAQSKDKTAAQASMTKLILLAVVYWPFGPVKRSVWDGLSIQQQTAVIRHTTGAYRRYLGGLT